MPSRSFYLQRSRVRFLVGALGRGEVRLNTLGFGPSIRGFESHRPIQLNTHILISEPSSIAHQKGEIDGFYIATQCII